MYLITVGGLISSSFLSNYLASLNAIVSVGLLWHFIV